MKKLIVANWKMNPSTAKEARELFSGILKGAKKTRQAKIVVCPPFVYLSLFTKNSKISLGGQDVFWEDRGSYTGEVSAKMLKDLGAEYVIIGHSERRHLTIGGGETDEMINKKIKQALKNNIKVIFCVGELERDEGGESFQRPGAGA